MSSDTTHKRSRNKRRHRRRRTAAEKADFAPLSAENDNDDDVFHLIERELERDKRAHLELVRDEPQRDPFAPLLVSGAAPLVKSGVQPLSADELRPLFDVGEMARRQLADLRPHYPASAGEASVPLAEAYVVHGLSARVPSPASAALDEQRARIGAQLAELDHRDAQWSAFATSIVEAPSVQQRSRAAQRNCERFYAQLERCAAIDRLRDEARAITALKPAAEARRLRGEWQRLLSETVASVREQFANTTRAAIGRTLQPPYNTFTAAEAEQRAAALTQGVLNQVADRVLRAQLAQIEASNYEDMPLLAETLQRYLAEYLSLSVQPVDDEEQAQLLNYYADTLERYATADYERWFERWLATAAEPLNVSAARAAELRRYVQRLVEQRRAAEAVRATGTARNGYFSVAPAMREAEARDAYRQLLLDELALERARAVAEPADGGRRGGSVALQRAFEEYLREEVSTPYETVADLLAYPTRDRFALLDAAVARRRNAIPRNDDARVAARAAVLERQLAERTRELEELVAALGGPRIRATAPHAPDEPRSAALTPAELRAALVAEGQRVLGVQDAIDTGLEPTTRNVAVLRDTGDTWSPFDLTYPLGRARSGARIGDMLGRVAAGRADFDADATHEAAQETRRALDANFARRVLQVRLRRSLCIGSRALTHTSAFCAAAARRARVRARAHAGDAPRGAAH